jgi:hypothetical protein
MIRPAEMNLKSLFCGVMTMFRPFAAAVFLMSH